MARDPTRPLFLVVDDEEGIRSLLTDILEDLGYAVVAAEDGEGALAAMERDRAEIRLVICDYVLPGKSGIETLKALRGVRPGLPAILSTGYDDRDETGASLREAAKKEGFEVLSKPYKIDALMDSIARALGTA